MNRLKLLGVRSCHRKMINLSKDDLELVIEWFGHLNNECRIEALEKLVRDLNRELWILRRSGETLNR